MSDPADPQRIIGDLFRLGTVLSVDLSAGTCRVQIGDIETGDLPWLAGSAGETHIWMPPSAGEQVAVIAPEGDTRAGIVLRGLPSDANPAPGDSRTVVMIFADGARISYDPEEQYLEARLPEGGRAKLLCDVEIDGKLKVTGDVQIDAKLHVDGEIASNTDVKAAAISLKSHKHTGVQAGAAQTGAAV